jgi:hypothetical protein
MALWGIASESPAGRRAALRGTVSRARGAAGAATTAFDITAAVVSGVAAAPGLALLLVWCFTTLTGAHTRSSACALSLSLSLLPAHARTLCCGGGAGVAPMAVHYAYLTAMDYTAKARPHACERQIY